MSKVRLDSARFDAPRGERSGAAGGSSHRGPVLPITLICTNLGPNELVI